MFKNLHTDGNARRGEFHTVRSCTDTRFSERRNNSGNKRCGKYNGFKEIGCQVELSNTYHLHLRPGTKL